MYTDLIKGTPFHNKFLNDMNFYQSRPGIRYITQKEPPPYPNQPEIPDPNKPEIPERRDPNNPDVNKPNVPEVPVPQDPDQPEIPRQPDLTHPLYNT